MARISGQFGARHSRAAGQRHYAKPSRYPLHFLSRRRRHAASTRPDCRIFRLEDGRPGKTDGIVSRRHLCRVPEILFRLWAGVQTGDLRQIAVSSGKRFPGLPDLATIAETVPGAVLDGWFVLAAPKGTPQPIVDRLNKSVKDFLGGADIQQRLIALGLATNGTDTPEKTAAFIQQEQQTWQKLAKEIDIQQQ
ncbi:Bug family tripartite tricarboxylate transporter substrate binding protein [Methylocella sp. CPCC 101449]|uniref:Bug family tripartite tricarboxylate transporter substrate binding protein n=1 Tax=Methylocella sp. CPCC 101449 TaxID=2987531 RepID=UPI003908B4D2